MFVYTYRLLLGDSVKVSATAAMFSIRLGGAFWNAWKKRCPGAAVSMTLVFTTHTRPLQRRRAPNAQTDGGARMSANREA